METLTAKHQGLTKSKEGIYKYKGIHLEETPTEKFPQLVTFIKTIKKAKEVEGKKFLTLEKGLEFIDSLELHLWERKTQIRLEEKERRVARKELMKLNGLQLLSTNP